MLQRPVAPGAPCEAGAFVAPPGPGGGAGPDCGGAAGPGGGIGVGVARGAAPASRAAGRSGSEHATASSVAMIQAPRTRRP